MILKQPYGFTLVELMVVLTILSVLLSFTIPIFKKTALSPDLEQMEDLARLISTLKHRAILENKDFFMHLDTGSGQVRISGSAQDEDGTEPAFPGDPGKPGDLGDPGEPALTITGPLHIAGIEFPGTSRDTGRAGSDPVIRFSRHGYSDQAILHLEGGKTPVSLVIEPFLLEPKTVLSRVSFDDCT